MRSNRAVAFMVLAAGVLTQSAFAHPGHAGHDVSGFAGGFAHPLGGLDHILAMLAVGIWAAQLGGRAFWLVPTAFVALMACAGGVGMSAGTPLPFIEAVIAASVLVLGLMIALAVRAPLYFSVPLVGLFAMFHGYAHGTEVSAGVSAFGYGAGFIVATATLHAAGIGMGLLAKKMISAPLVFRTAGAAIAVAGVALTMGWIGA